MNDTESEKPHSWWWVSHISPENSKWLAENLDGVDKSVKAMLKLIKEDGESFAEKAGMNHERGPDLIAHAEGFYRRYNLLAERYDCLTGELRKHVPSLLQMQNPAISQSGCGQDSLATPDYKSARKKFGQQSVGFDLFLSSGGSSDFSVEENSESSSLASDSEPESFDSSINKHSNPHVAGDVKRLSDTKEKVKVIVNKKEIADNELEIQENEDYAALLKRIAEYEEELKETNKKFQLSEEEVVRLKGGLKTEEAFTVLIGDLQAKLESAQKDINMREADLETEQIRVLELQKEVAELETQVSGSNLRIGTLVEELEIAREKLKVSEYKSKEMSECTYHLQGQLELAEKDIATLDAKLDSEKWQVLQLQETIVNHMVEISERDQEIEELNSALSNAQKTFSTDKTKLQSDVCVLSEQLVLLEARIVESELRSKLLENEIKRCEAEKKEMKCSHEAQQIGLCSEIEQLKTDVAERGELVEALNKKLDILKLKYDLRVAEKDGANAKVQGLIAEMNSQDKQIKQLEENMRQMHVECTELVIGSETAKELVDELRARVGELEKEVDRQRLVISDTAEGKREAIRQLCFSLEHYRNGYEELRQAFVGHRRHAVLAS